MYAAVNFYTESEMLKGLLLPFCISSVLCMHFDLWFWLILNQ